MFKSLTPLGLQRLATAVLAVGVVGVTIVTLGPFQGAEQRFGLSDKEAHAMAFFAVSVGLFLCAPHRRRLDLALMVLTFGVGIEVVQSLVGRDGDIADACADAIGVFGAVAPGMVERLRHHVRINPNVTFVQIAATDRRRRRSKRAAGAQAQALMKAQAARARMKAQEAERAPTARTVHLIEQY
jgi:hypothetical protein